MNAEALLDRLETLFVSQPPAGVSSEEVADFFRRHREGLRHVVVDAVRERGAEPGTPTPSGGRRGGLADPSALEPGRRVVTREGAHGTVLGIQRYVTRGATEPPRVWGSVDIELDSGLLTSLSSSLLYDELAPPVRVVTDVDLGGVRFRPEAAWKRVADVWSDVEYHLKKARTAKKPELRRSFFEEAQKDRRRALHFFSMFAPWRRAWPDEDVPGFDPHLFHLLEREAHTPGAATTNQAEREGPPAAPSESRTVASGRGGCFELTFDLRGHGQIRVSCGKPGRRERWDNLHIGSHRFGWNGTRWARDQAPPTAVLTVLREHGIDGFPEV